MCISAILLSPIVQYTMSEISTLLKCTSADFQMYIGSHVGIAECNNK